MSNRLKLSLCWSGHTISRVVVGVLICGTVDELAERRDCVGAHQCVAAEGTAVHHTDVEWRVQELILGQIL